MGGFERGPVLARRCRDLDDRLQVRVENFVRQPGISSGTFKKPMQAASTASTTSGPHMMALVSCGSCAW